MSMENAGILDRGTPQSRSTRYQCYEILLLDNIGPVATYQTLNTIA